MGEWKRDNGISIDKELLPLLAELNAVGLKTTTSCSGHGKEKAYIAIDLDSVAELRVINTEGKKCYMIRWELTPSPKGGEG